MALMRYIGPEAEVKVLAAGVEVGNVVQGGSIVVRDDLATMVAWPADLWENAAGSESENRIMAEHEKALAEAGSQPADPGFDSAQPGEEANLCLLVLVLTPSSVLKARLR